MLQIGDEVVFKRNAKNLGKWQVWKLGIGEAALCLFNLIAPSDLFEYTRTQAPTAFSAASNSERDHPSMLPSGPGKRTGQTNNTFCRFMAVKSIRVPKVGSVESSAHNARSTR